MYEQFTFLLHIHAAVHYLFKQIGKVLSGVLLSEKNKRKKSIKVFLLIFEKINKKSFKIQGKEKMEAMKEKKEEVRLMEGERSFESVKGEQAGKKKKK